ncbi:MAG: hypothetical protein P1P86_01540 [Bacteroidales bacterium]|nr:hypothetical protein [Bacteroidales bacterium]
MIVGTVMLGSSYGCSWETYQEYMNNNLYGTPMENSHSILLSWLYKGARIIHIAQILLYNTASFVYILRSRKHIQNSFSNLDKFQLHYFYLVNIVFLIFMAVPGIYVTIIGRAPFTENSHLLGIVTFLFTFLYVILGMVGLRQKAFTVSAYQKNETFNLLEESGESDHRF